MQSGRWYLTTFNFSKGIGRATLVLETKNGAQQPLNPLFRATEDGLHLQVFLKPEDAELAAVA